MTRICVLLLFFCQGGLLLSSQKDSIAVSRLNYPIVWKSHNKILIANEEMYFSRAEETFRLVPLAHRKYESAMKSRKASLVCGLIAFSTFPIGLLIARTDNSRRSTGVGTAIGALFFIVGTPVMIIASFVTKSEFKSKQKETVNLYNGLYQKYKDKNDALNLSIGLTSNGLGVTLSF